MGTGEGGGTYVNAAGVHAGDATARARGRGAVVGLRAGMHGVEEVGYVPVVGGREAAAAELVGRDVGVLPGGDEVPAGGDGVDGEDGGCEGRGEGGEEEENCGQPGGGGAWLRCCELGW